MAGSLSSSSIPRHSDRRAPIHLAGSADSAVAEQNGHGHVHELSESDEHEEDVCTTLFRLVRKLETRQRAQRKSLLSFVETQVTELRNRILEAEEELESELEQIKEIVLAEKEKQLKRKVRELRTSSILTAESSARSTGTPSRTLAFRPKALQEPEPEPSRITDGRVDDSEMDIERTLLLEMEDERTPTPGITERTPMPETIEKAPMPEIQGAREAFPDDWRSVIRESVDRQLHDEVAYSTPARLRTTPARELRARSQRQPVTIADDDHDDDGPVVSDLLPPAPPPRPVQRAKCSGRGRARGGRLGAGPGRSSSSVSRRGSSSVPRRSLGSITIATPPSKRDKVSNPSRLTPPNGTQPNIPRTFTLDNIKAVFGRVKPGVVVQRATKRDFKNIDHLVFVVPDNHVKVPIEAMGEGELLGIEGFEEVDDAFDKGPFPTLPLFTKLPKKNSSREITYLYCGDYTFRQPVRMRVEEWRDLSIDLKKYWANRASTATETGRSYLVNKGYLKPNQTANVTKNQLLHYFDLDDDEIGARLSTTRLIPKSFSHDIYDALVKACEADVGNDDGETGAGAVEADEENDAGRGRSTASATPHLTNSTNRKNQLPAPSSLSKRAAVSPAGILNSSTKKKKKRARFEKAPDEFDGEDRSGIIDLDDDNDDDDDDGKQENRDNNRQQKVDEDEDEDEEEAVGVRRPRLTRPRARPSEVLDISSDSDDGNVRAHGGRAL